MNFLSLGKVLGVLKISLWDCSSNGRFGHAPARFYEGPTRLCFLHTNDHECQINLIPRSPWTKRDFRLRDITCVMTLILIQIWTGCSWPMRNFCPTPLLDENQNSSTQNSAIPIQNTEACKRTTEPRCMLGLYDGSTSNEKCYIIVSQDRGLWMCRLYPILLVFRKNVLQCTSHAMSCTKSKDSVYFATQDHAGVKISSQSHEQTSGLP